MNLSFNFIKILRYNSLIYPMSTCMQSLRWNCENKDKLEQFISEINLKKSSKELNSSNDTNANENELTQYDGSEYHNESKLLQTIENICNKKKIPTSRSNWIILRNECLNYFCMNGSSNRFSEQFIKILNIYDSKFAEENQIFINFLTNNLRNWRNKTQEGQNLDTFIESLCDLYKHYSASKLSNQIILTTKIILRDIIKRHGSSAVVKITDLFRRTCEETGDYELLFILWKELFESEWYSDQQFSSQLIDIAEVRKILAKRTRYLCIEYFNKNETELANRLLQICLKYNMRANAELILKFYLAYECFQSNVSAATQVIKLCIELNIPLSESENRKYLNLLLKRPKEESKKINVEKYKFKF